jgi:hypothetical protein
MTVFHTGVPPAGDRDTGGYPFSKCCDKYWLTIELVVKIDGQKFVGLLPYLVLSCLVAIASTTLFPIS